MESESEPQDQTASVAKGAATPSAATPQTVDTPISKPLQKRPVFSRRLIVLGGFWSGLMLATVGILGSPFDFIYPRNVKGFGGPIPVTPDRIPEAGDEPRRIAEGRFWLLNLKAGLTPRGEETPGGLLALWTKCPHLGCTVPWKPGFTFGDTKGWFRCPCHGSTYTKDGGVIVFGPAPRSMDVFPLTVEEDRSITVQTGPGSAINGSSENPGRAAPYEPGSATEA